MFADPALELGHGAGDGVDDRVADRTLLHTFEVLVDVALPQHQTVRDRGVPRNLTNQP